MRRASALSPSYGGQFEQMEIANIEHAFLTHIHSDHSGGLADLILSPWVMGRVKELKLFGPKGLKDMATNITEAYKLDIDYRLHGTQPANKTGFVSIVKEIEEGVIFKDTNVTVTAFYKKIVFSGDTAISDNLKRYAKEVDILVHEVYSSEGFKSKTDDWKIYHRAHHTSSIDLGILAKELNPKTLVPSHILFWGASEKSILDDIRLNFSGKVLLAKDLMIVE
jgi:ribonuclease BN (tRNA processing enzyme)